MNQAQNIIPRLRQLSRLEQAKRPRHGSAKPDPSIAAEIESLRDLLPTSILVHHDSFKLRGKRSIAAVSRGICGACHLALPRGRVADLRPEPADLNVCDHCGVFIYLAEEPPPPVVAASSAAKKPAKRIRRRPTARTHESPQAR
jgi:predicted  nucleic acid-binding Zn-ribbon protein